MQQSFHARVPCIAAAGPGTEGAKTAWPCFRLFSIAFRLKLFRHRESAQKQLPLAGASNHPKVRCGAAPVAFEQGSDSDTLLHQSWASTLAVMV